MARYTVIKTTNLGSGFDPIQGGSCTRTLKIRENQSLFQLAEAIIAAYGFDLDHAFGFYDNLEDHYASTSVHTSFADFLDDDDPDHGLSVKKTKVSSVFEPGVERLFLFDYGDEWHFHLHCTETGLSGGDSKDAEVIAAQGNAPPQYPEYDEECES